MWQHCPGRLLFLQPPPCSYVGAAEVVFCAVEAEALSNGAERIITARKATIFFIGNSPFVGFKGGALLFVTIATIVYN
jgi:hypothetical protein